MAQTCKCTLMDKLIAEQFDTSYRTPAEPKKKHQVKTFLRTEKEQDARDLMMFNAGRFKAGDRDKAAIKANNTFELIISGRA